MLRRSSEGVPKVLSPFGAVIPGVFGGNNGVGFLEFV